MEANKNKNYQIKECDKEYYHILFTRKTYDKNKNDMRAREWVVIYDSKGYNDFKENKHYLGLSADEVIHIPEKMFLEQEKAKEKAQKRSTNKKNN